VDLGHSDICSFPTLQVRNSLAEQKGPTGQSSEGIARTCHGRHGRTRGHRNAAWRDPVDVSAIARREVAHEAGPSRKGLSSAGWVVSPLWRVQLRVRRIQVPHDRAPGALAG